MEQDEAVVLTDCDGSACWMHPEISLGDAPQLSHPDAPDGGSPSAVAAPVERKSPLHYHGSGQVILQQIGQTARLVGLGDELSNAYHLHLTNDPTESLDAHDIARSYTAGWAAELLFREMKQVYRLGELRSSNRYAVEALLYACILTLVVSQTLRLNLRRRCPAAAAWATAERWASLFQSLAPRLAELLFGHVAPGSPLERTLAMLNDEAPDFHLKRQGGLLGRVELGRLRISMAYTFGWLLSDPQCTNAGIAL